MLVLLLFSAGMYESATGECLFFNEGKLGLIPFPPFLALLPSTYTMYTTTFALSYGFYPSRSGSQQYPSSMNLAYTPSHRTLFATAAFALGALVGWPFALVLSFPFVFEEVFLPSGLFVSSKRYLAFVATRLVNWSRNVLIASIISVPLLIIDTLAYGRITLVPLNIIKYNILSSARGAGPELYGVEPWYYYLLNLSIQFGPALLLALLSIPIVLFIVWYDPRRIAPIDAADISKKAQKDHNTQDDTLLESSEVTLLLVRLCPLYLWLGLLTLQPHKEERFVFPAYPLLCFNAAVTLCLVRGLLERCYTVTTRSPYRASKTYLFSFFSTATLVGTSLICLSRIIHISQSYHAPISLLNHLSHHELPRVVANLHPLKQSAVVQDRMAKGLPPVYSAEERYNNSGKTQYESSGIEKQVPTVDLSLLTEDMGEQEPLRLCYGKEWHRFPTTYLVPDGVSVAFIKSAFDGILPKHFVKQSSEHHWVPVLDEQFGWLWPRKETTRAIQSTFNDVNREELDQYVDVSTCDYLIDLDYPFRSNYSPLEPRYVRDADQWSQVKCLPFLDSAGSKAFSGSSLQNKIRATLDRVLWLPDLLRGDTNRFGDYCLLRTTRETSVANGKNMSISGQR